MRLTGNHCNYHWAREWGMRFEYLQPGNPQQRAYVERFNRTVRYEWLSQYDWSIHSGNGILTRLIPPRAVLSPRYISKCSPALSPPSVT